MIRPPTGTSRLLASAAGVALATLVGAFAFQHIGGLTPCPLCIWQRWPYAIGAGLAGLAAILTHRNSAGGGMVGALAGLIFVMGMGLSAWHAGIEYGWWSGPSSCVPSLDTKGFSAEELLQALEATPPVRCDVAPWSLAGLSLAGWSALILAGLAAATLQAAWRLRVRDPVRHPNTENPPSSDAGNSAGISDRSP